MKEDTELIHAITQGVFDGVGKSNEGKMQQISEKIFKDAATHYGWVIEQHQENSDILRIDSKLTYRSILRKIVSADPPTKFADCQDILRTAAFESYQLGLGQDIKPDPARFEAEKSGDDHAKKPAKKEQPAPNYDLKYDFKAGTEKAPAKPKKKQEKKMETQVIETKNGTPDLSGILEGYISGIVAKHKPETKISPDLIREIVREELGKVAAREIKITIGDKETKISGRQHFCFNLVLKTSVLGCNVMMVGPTASGKTTLAAKVAEALGVPFYCLSCFPMMSPSKFEGYMDATGKYVPSVPYLALKEKKGAVLLVDEPDNGSAGVMTGLNALAANRCMTFPNGETVTAPEGFILIAGANTKGTGATREYCGRQRLDAATLDRFCMIEFPYDEGLEADLIGITGVASPVLDLAAGGKMTAKDWYELVKSARTQAAKMQLELIISPRAMIHGAKLAAAGFGKTWIMRLCFLNRLPVDQATRLLGAL